MLSPLLALILAVSPAAAGSLHYELFAAGRYNPLGQVQYLTLGWKQDLVDAPEGSLIFDESYLYIGPTVQLSPSFAALGGTVRVMPAAFVRLDLRVERILAWSDLSSVTDSAMPFTAASLELAQLGGALIGDGWRTVDSLLLQVAAGPIAARATATLHGWRLDLPDGAIFYDQANDFLAPAQGFGFSLDQDLLYLAPGRRPVLGLRYTLARPLAEIPDWGERALQRVGPLFAWTFEEAEPGGAWANPTLFVLAQLHLAHPFRTGDPTPQALPWMGLGFTVEGDLIRAAGR